MVLTRKKPPTPRAEVNLCDTDKLMTLLVTLQIVDPENIVKLAYKGNLGSFCKQVGSRLENAYAYMKTCYITPQQRLYSNLIEGVNSLYQTLCLDVKYRQAFEHHSDCFRRLYNELDNCDGPKDWAEDTNRTSLCKAYENIVDCYMIKTALICGPDAAEVFKKLLLNVLRATVVTDCKLGLNMRSFKEQNFNKPFITQKVFNIFYLIIIFILIVALVLVSRK